MYRNNLGITSKKWIDPPPPSGHSDFMQVFLLVFKYIFFCNKKGQKWMIFEEKNLKKTLFEKDKL